MARKSAPHFFRNEAESVLFSPFIHRCCGPWRWSFALSRYTRRKMSKRLVALVVARGKAIAGRFVDGEGEDLLDVQWAHLTLSLYV